MLAEDLHIGLASLAEKDKKFARALEEVGAPEVRHRDDGFSALLRIIIGQQVSVAAANSIEARVVASFPKLRPQDLLDVSDDDLRGCGLSYRKASYVRGLAEAILSGDLPLRDFGKLSDEEVIDSIVRLRGFGRWSAENYCLFSLGRVDIFPQDDLGLQAGLQMYRGLKERPKGVAVDKYVRRWRPYRSSAAIFIWHYYGCKLKDKKSRSTI